MLLICISMCILFSVSSVFANDVMNETMAESDLDVQVNSNDVNGLSADSLSTSVVYFDASAVNDGNGSQSNPYKYYKSDRIDYGTTAYFADGVYDITDVTSIYSSSTYKTTFVGQSLENTVLRSKLTNKFDFTVTDNSYFVLNNLTMIDVHINNQANLIANNVMFRDSAGFNPGYSPSLSYSYISKIYDSTYGGVIICDTPFNKVTTLNLTDCHFNSNSASSGGVIATYNTVASIQNCVFYNSTAQRFGGAIYSIKSNLTIRASSFEINDAKYGGAIYVNSSSLYLKDSQFSQSKSYSFGGVLASFSSKLDVVHVIFNDYASLNDAGGAIYTTGGTLNVADSSFKNGYSDFGGAICNLKCNSTIHDSKFINNDATYYGGSIYNMYGSVVFASNFFNNSHAESGGSIFNRLSDSFTLTNNRFINSTADEGPIVFIDGGNVNVIEDANKYDNSCILLKYGNIYDIDYYSSVPIICYSPESIDVLPSFYDSRKYGYVTPVKDQIQGGNCWAFSGIATLEACLKKATGVTYDFSEENVKNLMSEYSLFDSDNEVNGGGNLYMFIAYLAGWFGPTYDEYDVYDDYSSLSVIYDSIIHVQNVYILPERENFFDNDYIKRAVLEYGAVSIAIDLSENEGHAVTIVGWDDEFTSNDFLGNKAVGAWIIKNSWGSSWGYDGFGYLSYQQHIGFGYTFIFDDDRGYSNIYQYDFSGKKGYRSLNSDEVYIKNKFTAKNDEILSAFSTYFDEPTNFTAFVYLNGELVTTQNGYCEMGYYTVPLNEGVYLKKGDTFEIAVKIFNAAPVYIPMSPADEINKINFDKGISFYSIDGVEWIDLYELDSPGVACIKAFTRLESLTEVSIDVDLSSGDGHNPFDNVYVGDLVNIKLDLPQEFVVDGFSQSLEGLVIFTINNQSYYATAENGKACLNFTFDEEGVYEVTAQYKSSRVVSNIVNFTINVEKTAQSNLLIQANDVSKFYGGSEKYVVTLIEDDQPLIDVNVRIAVDGKNDTYKTDNNGQVILDLDYLPVGVYDIYAQFGGKIISSKFTVLTTIGIADVTRDTTDLYVSRNFLDVYVPISFLNTDGSILSNQKIIYEIGQYTFNAITNVVGLATANFNEFYIGEYKYYFPVGKYPVSVTNPINGEKKQFTLEILPIDSTCSISVTQLGSVVTISASVGPARASGYVNFIILGNIHKVKVVSGAASLVLSNLTVGEYNVTAFYSNDVNLKVSSDTKRFYVTENAYELSSGNYWGYYGDSGTIASITDENGNGIKGEVVKATVLNKTYYNVTDEEGLAWFNLDYEVGNYTVLFEYNGQSIFNTIEVRSTINVVDFSGEYLNTKVGASFIDPYRDEPTSLDVKFIINGKEYAATTDNNGYASVNADLPVGTHIITIINLVNGEKKQSKITIYKTTPTITLTKSKRGEFILFTASLAQSSAVGNVVFTMGSKKYTSLVIDGKSILALNVLEEGSYEIYANYIGDTNFNNIFSSTMKFDYVQTDYNFTAPKLSKYYGGPEKFTVNLTNFNKPVSNAIINIYIDEKEYDIKTDVNGVASFEGELNPGTHVVRCSYDDETALSEITVKSTIATTGDIAGVSYSKISAEFKDGNGDLIKNRMVTLKVDSKEYYQTTDDMGVATFKVNLDKGNYTVAIVNPITGEIKYATLIITMSTPNLVLSVAKVNGRDILRVVLPKTATGDVDFILDNGDVYSVEIKDGVCILEDVDPGEYMVNVSYKGNDEFYPVSKSIRFDVSQVDVSPLTSVLNSQKITTTYGISKNIIVTLKDSNGNPLVGRRVSVNLNYKIYYGVVQSDGKARIAIPTSLAAKTYTATIAYAGDTSIYGNAIKINVVVNKAIPKLIASKKKFKLKTKTKKYVVTLKTNKNKVYKKQKLTIKVRGKTYYAKTNSKGKATFKLTKLTKRGTFTATIKYKGNSNFKAITKKVKITVR